MAERALNFDLPEVKVRTGLTFLGELKALGLDPDILVWAVVDEEWQLILITSLADRVGSFSLYDLLFLAQDRGLVTKEMDLMSLSIYSPKSELGGDFERNLPELIGKTGHIKHDRGGQDLPIERAAFSIGLADPISFHGRAVLQVNSSGFSAHDDLRRWKRAETSVSRAAA